MYTETGDAILVGSSQTIRKQYYKADVELDKYELCRKHKITSDRVKLGSFKGRLQRHAQSLSEYEAFFTRYGEIANRIVDYELVQDEAYRSDDVRYVLVQDGIGYSNKAPDPSFHCPDQKELQAKISYLKDRFGLEAIKAVLGRFGEPKQKGRQKFWYPMRLFTIWFVVQNIAHFEDSNIDSARERI